MGKKARLGFTRDFLDKDGKFVFPSAGLKLLEEMPEVEYKVFPEFLAEVTPEQIQDFDMVFLVLCLDGRSGVLPATTSFFLSIALAWATTILMFPLLVMPG